MGKRKEHDEIVKGLRKSFPKLTEFELAELSLKYLQSNTTGSAKSGKKAKFDPDMTGRRDCWSLTKKALENRT